MKGIFYKKALTLAMIYGQECFPIKNHYVQKMNLAKMGIEMDEQAICIKIGEEMSSSIRIRGSSYYE